MNNSSWSLNKNQNRWLTAYKYYVFKNLRDPISLAIWSFLISLPLGNTVSPSYLMKHFMTSRKKIYKSLKILYESDLIELEQNINRTGLVYRTNILAKNGRDFLYTQKNQSTN